MAPLVHVTLFRGRDAWYVDHAPDPSAGLVRDLFGTTILPLPFGPAARIETVCARLRAGNPGVRIDVPCSLEEV